jgi:hypothetical protein
MVRVNGEGFLVFRPGIADGLERGSPAEGFEVLGEVVGGDEGIEVSFEAVEGLIVEGPNSGIP